MRLKNQPVKENLVRINTLESYPIAWFSHIHSIRRYKFNIFSAVNFLIPHRTIFNYYQELVKTITSESIYRFYKNLYPVVIGKWQQVAEIMKIPVIYTPKNIYTLKRSQDELDKPIAATHPETEISVRFQTNILSQINDAVIVTDIEHRITYWNRQAEELYGIPVSHVIGQPLSIAFECVWLHPEQQQAYIHALADNGCWKGENIHRQWNGEEIHVESSISVLKDGEGAVIGFLVLVRDLRNIYQEICLRQIAEQRVQEQAALIDITTDAILVLSLDGEILFCNQGGQKIYGWEAKQMLGENVHRLLYDDGSLPQLELALKTVLEQGEWCGELYQYRKDERKIIVQAKWRVIRDGQGNPQSILTVATDVTEKKQLEAQFLRTQRLQSIGTLASGIAHDLNNVLTPILAVAQLLPLKLPHLDENTQGLLKIVLENCKRGSDLIKQILSFARGAETLRTNLQVGHLLVEVARVARQTFPKSIEICMDIAAKDLWMVSADATQLHQVLMNLCLNARDAMVSRGTLTLAIANLFIDEKYAQIHLDARVGPYVAIAISDTGCGITTENLDQIFEPFFTTKELGEGTGLGLSTVLGIIKSHGGFVNVDSEIGKGTCFKVYLPAVSGTEQQTYSELEVAPGSGELILVVDDELSILEVTQISLETYNYQVLIAKDGIEAIALFAKHEREIKAVLIDLMMPTLDSITTIRTLQKLNPQVPIIVMSGLTSNEVLAKAANTNIQAFLAKPFTAWELLNTLQKVRIQGSKYIC